MRSSVNSDDLLELAGTSRARANRPTLGVPEHESAALCVMVNAARRHAGLTSNQFLRMNRAERRAFCTRYDFSRAEVRLVQSLAKVTREMMRTQIISNLLSRTDPYRVKVWSTRQ